MKGWPSPPAQFHAKQDFEWPPWRHISLSTVAGLKAVLKEVCERLMVISVSLGLLQVSCQAPLISAVIGTRMCWSWTNVFHGNAQMQQAALLQARCAVSAAIGLFDPDGALASRLIWP